MLREREEVELLPARLPDEVCPWTDTAGKENSATNKGATRIGRVFRPSVMFEHLNHRQRCYPSVARKRKGC